MQNPAHLFKILQEEEMRELGLQVQRDLRKEPNPRISLMMFGLEKP